LEVKLSAILNLQPEDARQLHPLALKWFNERNAAIEQQLMIDGLTVDDVETFLSGDEKNELQRYKSEIEMALLVHINPDPVYRNPLFDGSLGPDFLMMQLRSFIQVEKIKSLLRRVYGHKWAIKPEAVKKKHEAERRKRASAALNPPIDLARKYLNCPGEYERFGISINGAVDAYLEAGEFYVYQEKASAYLRCLEAVEDKRREERRKQRAQSAADTYNHHLNEEIGELTTRLYRREKNLSDYFRAAAQDKRYSGDNFDYILSDEEEKELDPILVSVANKQLERLCPEDLRQFIVLPSKYYRCYYPLPSASYSFEEVPCLDFSFEIFAAAYAEVCLKQRKKTFDGFEFSLPSVEEKNGLSVLKSPRFLGYYYSILRPEDLNARVFWESIPLVLLKGLLAGETKPEGATITAASENVTTYRVQGFEEEVDVPDKFAKYLKTIGSIDGMVSVGIITEKIAAIVIAELARIEKEHGGSSIEGTPIEKDTRKAKAFQLFSQGKRPSHPEVKGLGVKPSTAYRYYQAWKQTHSHSQV